MISVCMATYNGEKYLKPQIESILCQLGKNDELVISDNFSTDNTVNIIESFCDDRIKLFRFPQNKKLLRTRHGKEKNVTNNFENALRKSSGEYIFFADQDDVWKPEKIKTMMSYMKKYSLVMCNATTIDGYDSVLMEKLYSKNPLRKGILSFRARGCLCGMDRKLIATSLPIPKTIVSHDLWVGILAEFMNSYYFIDTPLVFHRRNIGNVSTDISQKSKNSLFYKIYYRGNLLVNGFIRIVARRKLLAGGNR